MRIDIDTIAEIGKGLSIKREKASEAEKNTGAESERIVCHLKFSGAPISRDELNAIVGAELVLWDEVGTPLAPMTIALDTRKLTFVGKVGGDSKRGEAIVLADASLKNITITPSLGMGWGATLAGELTWNTAGDEADDLHGLLGLTCALVGALHDGQQADLFRLGDGITSVEIRGADGNVLLRKERNAA